MSKNDTETERNEFIKRRRPHIINYQNRIYTLDTSLADACKGQLNFEDEIAFSNVFGWEIEVVARGCSRKSWKDLPERAGGGARRRTCFRDECTAAETRPDLTVTRLRRPAIIFREIIVFGWRLTAGNAANPVVRRSIISQTETIVFVPDGWGKHCPSEKWRGNVREIFRRRRRSSGRGTAIGGRAINRRRSTSNYHGKEEAVLLGSRCRWWIFLRRTVVEKPINPF